jgi:hypothetical protein
MKNWTARDWGGVVVGWSWGVAAYLLVPGGDTKVLLVFLAGFTGAWITRLLIPR